MTAKQIKVGDFVKGSGGLVVGLEHLIGEHGIVVGSRHNNKEGGLRHEEVIVHLANPLKLSWASGGSRMWFTKKQLELVARAQQ